ncbi:MAG: glycoside hydrolase family 10 protein [Cyanobacteria bacterium SBC]|nr:glycoside hydrolase family 10 protein [Cyanobacteria bacterium SBC]
MLAKIKSIDRKIILALGLFFLIVATQLIPVSTLSIDRPTQPLPNEIRGVWITNVGSSVLFAPWGIRRALDRLSALNFNTIYTGVWNRGYTFYPSAVNKRVTGIQQAPFFSIVHPGSDVLKDTIELGHHRQLRVIPWFEYGFMVPRQARLALKHPEWLTTHLNDTAQNTPDWQSIFKGNPQAIEDWRKGQNLWLNPFHPEVQDFILQTIVEVVTNYDVDGIQLDDHFGLPIEMGYDPFTIQLYQQSHQGQSPPANPSDIEWVSWRADRISAFMGKIVETVRSIQSDCIISLSPNSQDFAYHYYLQDWQFWVQQGWIDELVLQVYRSDLSRVRTELDRASVIDARQRIPVAVGLLSGLWRKPVEIDRLQEQVNFVREQNFDGVSFFYWESLLGYLAPESPYQRQRFLQDLFANL